MRHHLHIYTAIFLFGAAGCSSNSDAARPYAPAPPVNLNRKAYVGLFGEQAVAVLDTVTKQVLKKIPVTAPDGLIITPDGAKVYVSGTDTGSVKVITTAEDAIARSILDVASGQLAPPIASGGSPHDVRPTADGKFELTVSQTAGDLEFIDIPSATVVARVPTGKLAHWITPLADGSGAYVSNEGDSNVVAVDYASRSVTSTIAIGTAPRKMALQP